MYNVECNPDEKNVLQMYGIHELFLGADEREEKEDLYVKWSERDMYV